MNIAEKNLQGGSWTRNQYGGARDGTGICLDICGWDGSCFVYSARRRTDSNPFDFASDFDFAPGFNTAPILLRVVSEQWGARRVPAGAAVSFLAAPALDFHSLSLLEAMESVPTDLRDRRCD